MMPQINGWNNSRISKTVKRSPTTSVTRVNKAYMANRRDAIKKEEKYDSGYHWERGKN